MYETPSLQRSGAIMLLGLHSLILFIYLFEKEALDMLLLLQQHCDTSILNFVVFCSIEWELTATKCHNSLGFKCPNTDKELMTFCCSDHQRLVSGVIFYNLRTGFHQWHKKDYNFYLLGGTGRPGREGAQYCSLCLSLLCCYWFLMGRLIVVFHPVVFVFFTYWKCIQPSVTQHIFPREPSRRSN